MMFKLLTSLAAAALIWQLTVPLAKTTPAVDLASTASESGGDVALVTNSLPLSATKPQAPIKKDQQALGVVTTADSLMIVDRATGAVLLEKNAHQPRSIASITKLMTALVFLEHNPGWDKVITLTAQDLQSGGVAGLRAGQQFSSRDLFYAMLVRSVNAAAEALARSTDLSPEQFITAMNDKAKELGLSQTAFVEPTGLDNNNRSTAGEVVKLVNVALTEPAIANATTLTNFSLQTVDGQVFHLEATDELLSSFLNNNGYKIIGGKTGYIDDAGYCLTVVVANRAGHEVISVVLGSKTLDERFTDTKAAVNWVYSYYQWPE